MNLETLGTGGGGVLLLIQMEASSCVGAEWGDIVKIDLRKYYLSHRTNNLPDPFSRLSLIHLIVCGGIVSEESTKVNRLPRFTLMVRSAHSGNPSQLVSSGGFGLRETAVASVLLAGITLETMASGLQNGL